LQNFLSVQIFTYETMPENTDLSNAKAVRRVRCNSRTYTKLFEIRRGVYIQRLTCESMSVSNIIYHPFT